MPLLIQPSSTNYANKQVAFQGKLTNTLASVALKVADSFETKGASPLKEGCKKIVSPILSFFLSLVDFKIKF